MNREIALIMITLLMFASLAKAQQSTNEPYANENNYALFGSTLQSSDGGGEPGRAIDGNTAGNFAVGSTTLSGGVAADEANPDGPLYGRWTNYWWVDLQQNVPIGSLHIWFRTDCCQNRNDDFTMVVLDSNTNTVLNIKYNGRPPLNVLYNLSPTIQGRYVIFVPQNPPTTSDGVFSLAEVQVIAPYTNVTINVTTNPPNVGVTEGRLATFGPVSATVVGPPQDRLTYQWQKDGIDIPGATGTTYTTPVVLLTDNNAQFRVRCAVSGVATFTTPATLSVAKDTVPPVINALSFSGGSTLMAQLVFDEVLDPASSTNTANYNFGAGVTVTRATLSPVLKNTNDLHVYQTVTLKIGGLPQNVPYSLTVSGVKDLGLNTHRC